MSDWSSIDGFYMAVSGLDTQTNVGVSGTTVTSIQSTYGLNAVSAAVSGPDPVTYEPGVVTIGQLPAFYDGGANKQTDMTMGFTFGDEEISDPPAFDMGLGATIVAIVQLDNPAQGSVAFSTASGNSSYGDMRAFRNGSQWRFRVGNTSHPTTHDRTTEPTVLIVTQDGTANSATMYIGDYNGGAWSTLAKYDGYTHSKENGIIDKFNLLNSDPGSDSSMYGKGAVFALYNSGVDDASAQLLYDIAQSYVDTGAAIPTGNPPSVSAITPPIASGSVDGSLTFNCTVTGDGPPTEVWEVSTDGGVTWQLATAVFDNPVITPGQIVINALAEQTDTLITLRASNDTTPSGVVGIPATFSVLASYPTSERFGPVRANDTNANYTWSIQPPGEAWQDLPVVGYESFVPDVEGDNQYLNINSATSSQNGTLVRCFAKMDYSDGIYTNVNTLNVVGESPEPPPEPNEYIWDFKTQGFDSRWLFDRSSTASALDDGGVLRTVDSDVPVLLGGTFDSPATGFTGPSQGLLMEAGSTNRFPYSEDVSSWENTSGLTASGRPAPDGTNTAHTISVNNWQTSVFVQTSTPDDVAGVASEVSLWVNVTADGGVLDIFDAYSADYGRMYLDTGHADVLNQGWVRIDSNSTGGAVTLNTPFSTSPSNKTILRIRADQSGLTTIDIWGVQHEYGGLVTSYIKTNGDSIMRANAYAGVALANAPGLTPDHDYFEGSCGQLVLTGRGLMANDGLVSINNNGSGDNRCDIALNSLGDVFYAARETTSTIGSLTLTTPITPTSIVDVRWKLERVASEVNFSIWVGVDGNPLDYGAPVARAISTVPTQCVVAHSLSLGAIVAHCVVEKFRLFDAALDNSVIEGWT